MGCAGSSEGSTNIDKQLAQDHQAETSKIKLLLLGAGESGKSTIFKQLRAINGRDVTDDERRHFTQLVMTNIIVFMKALQGAVERFNYNKELPSELHDAYDTLTALSEYDSIDQTLANTLQQLWQSEIFQRVWEMRAQYQVVDSHKVFVDDIIRIGSPDFLATHQDMLLTRVRTSGIVTEEFAIDGIQFELYDVGGQRNERKKWIHCFDGVTAVLFVAALSEYDLQLYEDATTNRMVEAIELFADVCNNSAFTESSMILFLNKKDLFEEKVKQVHIGSVATWNDYTGAFGDADAGCEYFMQKFRAVNRNPQKDIYHHYTCATDENNVRVVWASAKDTVLKNSLKDSGFL